MSFLTHVNACKRGLILSSASDRFGFRGTRKACFRRQMCAAISRLGHTAQSFKEFDKLLKSGMTGVLLTWYAQRQSGLQFLDTLIPVWVEHNFDMDL